MLVAQLHPTIFDPVDCSLQSPLSMEFSRQGYWSGEPFPSPGDLPDPGIEQGKSSTAFKTFFHNYTILTFLLLKKLVKFYIGV